MTEGATPQKLDPETLVLRAKPRRVVRFKRKVLIGAAAMGCLGLVGLTWFGLRGPQAIIPAPRESYDPDKTAETQKPKPDQLQSLPKTYAELPAGVPRLGPPLPGDLGKPMLEAQKAQAETQSSTTSSVPSPSTQPSGVFFQNSRSPDPSGLPPVAFVGNAGLVSPESVSTQQIAPILSEARRNVPGVVNPHSLQKPMSPYQVMAGTIISATLVTGLNSNLPGVVIAQLTEPLYDSLSGRILLAPQGTRLIGEYSSVVAFGQSRALVVWKRMVLPDGGSVELDDFPAADTSGYAGLADKVDFHTWSLLKGIGLSTVLGMTAVSGEEGDSDLVKALRESTRQTANEVGQRIVDKTLNVQPTITVRPGWPLRIIVHKDLVLEPYVH